MRIKSCVLLPAAGRRTQIFILLFSEPGVCGFADPCTGREITSKIDKFFIWIYSLIHRFRPVYNQTLSVLGFVIVMKHRASLISHIAASPLLQNADRARGGLAGQRNLTVRDIRA